LRKIVREVKEAIAALDAAGHAFADDGAGAAERGGGAAPPAVGTHSELWSYEIAGGSATS